MGKQSRTRAMIRIATGTQHAGFTLIETLIVAIMLAVLAAIVVPAFQGTTEDSRLSALESNLTSMRKAIDLYHAQHGHYPGEVKSQGTCSAGTNTDTATPGAAAFVAHMTQYTNKAGVACSQPGSNGNYGPYLSKIPVNPMTGIDLVTAIQTGSLEMSSTSGNTDGGWLYDFVTGRIIADQPMYEDR